MSSRTRTDQWRYRMQRSKNPAAAHGSPIYSSVRDLAKLLVEWHAEQLAKARASR